MNVAELKILLGTDDTREVLVWVNSEGVWVLRAILDVGTLGPKVTINPADTLMDHA